MGGGGRVAGGVPVSVGAGALPRQCRCDSDVLTDKSHSLPQVSPTQVLNSFSFHVVL